MSSRSHSGSSVPSMSCVALLRAGATGSMVESLKSASNMCISSLCHIENESGIRIAAATLVSGFPPTASLNSCRGMRPRSQAELPVGGSHTAIHVSPYSLTRYCTGSMQRQTIDHSSSKALKGECSFLAESRAGETFLLSQGVVSPVEFLPSR